MGVGVKVGVGMDEVGVCMEEVGVDMEEVGIGMEVGVGMEEVAVEVLTGVKVSDVGGLTTKGRTFINGLYCKEIWVHLLDVISGVTRGNKVWLEHCEKL